MTTKYTTEEVKQLYSIAVDQGWDALESNEKIAVGRYCRKHGINRPGLEPQTAPSPLPEQATETPAPQPAEETQSTQTQTETGAEPITGEQYFKHLGLGPAESVETEISKLETPQTGDATASDTDLELLRSVRFIERWPDDIVTTPARTASKWKRIAQALRRRLRNAKFVGFQPKGSYRVEIAPDRRHKDCYVVIAQYRGAEQ